VSASVERPPGAEGFAALPGGLSPVRSEPPEEQRLDSLPVGAYLVLRCRKDWRVATVAARSLEHVTLSVGTPRGRTYRVKRPPDTIIIFDGPFPILGEGCWRAGLVRYDARW
jgi:hypothetical protein